MTSSRAPRSLVKLNVKLAKPDAEGVPEVLRDLPGVERVTQTFPGERDEELATLYLLDIETSRADGVLRTLRADPQIDYVEKAATRSAKPRPEQPAAEAEGRSRKGRRRRRRG